MPSSDHVNPTENINKIVFWSNLSFGKDIHDPAAGKTSRSWRLATRRTHGPHSRLHLLSEKAGTCTGVPICLRYLSLRNVHCGKCTAVIPATFQSDRMHTLVDGFLATVPRNRSRYLSTVRGACCEYTRDAHDHQLVQHFCEYLRPTPSALIPTALMTIFLNADVSERPNLLYCQTKHGTSEVWRWEYTDSSLNGSECVAIQSRSMGSVEGFGPIRGMKRTRSLPMYSQLFAYPSRTMYLVDPSCIGIGVRSGTPK